jgi:hypothetical protein
MPRSDVQEHWTFACLDTSPGPRCRSWKLAGASHNGAALDCRSGSAGLTQEEAPAGRNWFLRIEYSRRGTAGSNGVRRSICKRCRTRSGSSSNAAFEGTTGRGLALGRLRVGSRCVAEQEDQVERTGCELCLCLQVNGSIGSSRVRSDVFLKR